MVKIPLEDMLPYMEDSKAVIAAVFIGEEPVLDGLKMLHIFTDDGQGNGEEIISVPLNRVIELAKQFKQERGW